MIDLHTPAPATEYGCCSFIGTVHTTCMTAPQSYAPPWPCSTRGRLGSTCADCDTTRQNALEPGRRITASAAAVKPEATESHNANTDTHTHTNTESIDETIGGALAARTGGAPPMQCPEQPAQQNLAPGPPYTPVK